MRITHDLYYDLQELLKIHDVIAISGAPGIGKSEIAYQVAEKLGLKMLEVRLYEQGDTAAGLPILNNKVMEFSKPWWFVELEENCHDILFLDDFHNVQPSIQRFFYRLLTDKMLHNYKLDPKLKIILAGNFDIDSAGSAQIQSPIMGRIESFIEFKPTIDNFLKWADLQIDRFDTRVLAFLRANPDLLYEPDPAPTTKYPSPRTWEHLSKSVSFLNSPKYAQSIVGIKAGSVFEDFWEYLSKDVDEILDTEPESIQQQVIYSIVLASAYQLANKTKRNRILKYISNHMSQDVIFLFARNVFEREGFSFIKHTREKFKKIYNTILVLKQKLDEIAK